MAVQKKRKLGSLRADELIRRELCENGAAYRNAPSRFGKRVAADALADAREAAKARGWTAKRIRRAERCRGFALR